MNPQALIEQILTSTVYDPKKNRAFPSSPFWKTADAGNDLPVGSKDRMRAKLLAPTQDLIMAGTTGPKKLDLKKNAEFMKAMRREPYPEDVGIFDQAVDILRNRKAMPSESKGAKNALYTLAEGYLSQKERPESGAINSIIKNLQKKFQNAPSEYSNYSFATLK